MPSPYKHGFDSFELFIILIQIVGYAQYRYHRNSVADPDPVPF